MPFTFLHQMAFHFQHRRYSTRIKPNSVVLFYIHLFLLFHEDATGLIPNTLSTADIRGIASSTAFRQQKQHEEDLQHIMTGGSDIGGVTSIVASDVSCSNIYIGTKRGKLFQVDQKNLRQLKNKRQQEEGGNVINEYASILNQVLQNSVKQQQIVLKPYPIYSMDIISTSMIKEDTKQRMILCGGGDRFVTIWQEVEEELENNWSINSRLGPHTGWVKDVIYDHMNDFIFSIGCNCIEVWYNTDERSFEHLCKLTIDSCQDQGSTLSSDLLCLSTFSSTHNFRKGTILFGGGVDGRIHSWIIEKRQMHQGQPTLDKTKTTAKASNFKVSINSDNIISAHNGRVNKITVCHKFNNTLLSIGNDGAIKGYNIEITETKSATESIRLINKSSVYARIMNNKLQLYSGVNNIPTDLRLLAMCLIYEDSERAVLAVGTSSGLVFLVETNHRYPTVVDSDMSDDSNDSDGFNIALLNNYDLSLNGNPTVHCLSCFNTAGNHEETNPCHEKDNREQPVYKTIAIGHSNGVTFWDVCLSLEKDT